MRDKFWIRPPIEGIANRDDQVSYSGTYTAQFRHKQAGLPTVQLGRLRFFGFCVPRTLPDPEIILENQMFARVMKLEPEGQGSLGLKFWGTTKERQISLDVPSIFMEE